MPSAAEVLELGVPTEDEASSSTDAEVRAPGGRCSRAAKLGALGLVASASVLLLAATGRPGRAPHLGASGAVAQVSLSASGAAESMAEQMANTMESVGNAIKAVDKTADKATKTEQSVVKAANQTLADSTEAAQNVFQGTKLEGSPFMESLKNGSFKEWMKNPANYPELKGLMSHHDDLHDGNMCADDEEEHAALCYKKCELLTDGEYPVRGSAFSCCRAAPCSLFNQRFKMSICGGFDVAGDEANNACPHQRGACYADEELSLNTCFKRCAILTYGEFPFRHGAGMCCKYNSVTACMQPGAYAVDGRFMVGGGELEGDTMPLSNVTAKPHPPLLSQAEVASD